MAWVDKETSPTLYKFLKYFGLVVGCMAKFVTGSLFTFNVYQEDIKTMFNYTQTEVELQSSLLNLGLGIGFIPGVLYDKFGPFWTSAAGLCVSVGSYMLLWSTTKNISFYKSNSWLMSIFFLLCVELQSSLLNLGLGIGFIPGVLYDKFGPFWTSAAGLCVSVGSYMLLWSTTKNISFYKSNSWLMSIFFLLCGLGSAFTYMVALNTNMINLDKRYRGTIVGLLNAFFAGSPSVFVQIYLHVLKGADKYADFLLIFAISFAVVDILCMIFLRIYTDDSHDDTIDIVPNEYKEPETEMNNIEVGKPDNSSCFASDDNELSENDTSMTLGQILCNVDYHLFSWMFVFAAAIGLVFLNNLTTVSRSVGLNGHDSVLLILIPVCNAITSLTLGFLSDLLKQKVPRMTLLLISCILFSASLALTIMKGSVLGLLILSTILCGIGTGMIWTLSPTVLSEKFALQNIGRNWGITILLAAVVGLGIQETFGHLYDIQPGNQRGGTCKGLACVRGGLAVGLASGILSILLCIVFIAKNRIRTFLAQRTSKSIQ